MLHSGFHGQEQSTGSDWSLEVLALSLDKTFAKCQRNQEAWPNHLRLYTDNTPKDAWQDKH